MTLQEFAALKLGDKIENPTTDSRGEVVEVVKDGVRVRWGDGRPGNNITFLFTPVMTTWMHWRLANDGGA